MMSAAGIAPFTVPSAVTAEPSAAGDVPVTVIGDRVWNDKDADGEQEIGEGGYNGVTVQLLDKRNRVIDSTVTAGNGNYRFEGREPGVYYVRLIESTLPDGLEMTHDFDGGATELSRLTLRKGHVRLNLDFGYRKTVTSEVHDVVWFDINGDGERSNFDVGIADVEVVLLRDGEELDRVVTRRNGYFRFEELAIGNYEVVIDKNSLPFAVGHAREIAVPVDGNDLRLDLGFDDFGVVPLGD